MQQYAKTQNERNDSMQSACCFACVVGQNESLLALRFSIYQKKTENENFCLMQGKIEKGCKREIAF